MSAAIGSAPLLIFGGAFDPLHKGHVGMAEALGDALQAREIRLLPVHLPPHRPPPVASSKHRLEMARRVADAHGWRADDREMRRGGTSWTVDTLRELRAEIGPAAPLCLALGMDAFASLHRWRDWRSLPEYAHLAVCARAGVAAPAEGPAAQLLAERRVKSAADLRRSSGGGVWVSEIQPLDCSSHRIRAALAAGEDARARRFLPPPVWEYICEQGLYGAGADGRG